MRDILDAPRRSLGGRVWNGPTTGIGTSRPSIARLCRAGAVDAPAVADPSSENLGWHSTHDAARPYVLDDDGPCAHDGSPPDPDPGHHRRAATDPTVIFNEHAGSLLPIL
jgi:hypothetical protein